MLVIALTLQLAIDKYIQIYKAKLEEDKLSV
jgi:hypothetical protein